MQQAKAKCIELGDTVCKAITCSGDGVCTVRASSMLKASTSMTTTYVPNSVCYGAGDQTHSVHAVTSCNTCSRVVLEYLEYNRNNI